MDFFFRAIQAVSGFVLGVFGLGQPEPEPAPAEAVYEVSVATTTAVVQIASTTAAEKPVTVIPPANMSASVVVDTVAPQPVMPSVAPVVAPAPVPATAAARSSGGSGISSQTAQPIELSIDADTLKKVSEKDVITLKALLTMSDGSTKNVSTEVAWEVVGPIGSITQGIFTAKLDPSIAEFGRGPGVIAATYTDPATGKEFTADTGIFDVSAYVPSIGNTQGQ